MSLHLAPHPRFKRPKGPVICCVMDGIGLGRGDAADAVSLAHTPALDWLLSRHASRLLAHGTHVGLPSDGDMGNSEVGHNALGAGRVFDQGALLVNKSIESGALYEGAVWQQAMARAKQGGALHFLGLLSDGNVHSHMKHLLAMLRRAFTDGAKKLLVHVLLDGRDVEPVSALPYIKALEDVLGELANQGADAAIASGGGRMTTTMDRYEAEWDMVQRGWHTHVLGEGRNFPNATVAIETLRKESPGIIDQNLPAFVITADGKPVGPIEDGDTVINFNFRGDRAIEISRAFDEPSFAAFDRKRVPDVLYAGMMEYDGDLHIPKHYLVTPPAIDETQGEYLASAGVKQLAISETQKFGHVTYFWNGNRSGYFDAKTEDYLEVTSETTPFDQRPWMQAAEITDRLIQHTRERDNDFIRVNYANGDMVGHTGDITATRIAVEVVDAQLRRLVDFVNETDGILVVTADHGNADEMYQRDKKGDIITNDGEFVARTSHSLNQVPFTIHRPGTWPSDVTLADGRISQVSTTCVELLGFTPPTNYDRSLLETK